MDDATSKKLIDIWVFPILETFLNQFIIATRIFRGLERPGVSMRPMSRNDAVENRADAEYVGRCC